ncbi:8456_t:CDS:2 [Gigaspora margarita]|uniref:8456_t:CDS:1 n=1 Tax=Gigaspora margarita TaxID=4874 RepID=A0ABN7UPZ9_GIGMA|nr:8456_t:CDS:2 [Gigaspora margarita]
MSQNNINNESYNEFNNLEEELSENKADEVANQEVSGNFFLPVTSVTRKGISKRRPLETLSIPDATFKQAANLYVGLHYELCSNNVHFIKVYWQLPQNIIDKVGFYVDAIPDINKYLANIIQHFRKGNIADPKKNPENDVSNLLKALRILKEEDPTWFIANYYNIARMNKYRLALCLFIGVDEHRHSRLLAQALMLDKMTLLYTWVLNNLLTATNNLFPLTIFSDCDTGLGPAIEKFNARMLSTQCIESINAVTHKYVNSHSSLMRFFNRMQAMLVSELQKAEYRDYLKNLLYNIGSSASSQADTVDNDACIEDYLDKRQIAFKSLIGCVDPNNIIELWKVKHMNANTVSTNCIVLLQDQSHVNIIFDSHGISNSENFSISNNIQHSFVAMNTIQNLRSDDVNLNSKEIEDKISKQQIYGECSVLGQKLAALASEFNLMHISATLRGLIQQVEQANSILRNEQDSNSIQNLFQANARKR